MAVKTASGAPAPISAGSTTPAAKKGFWAWLNKRMPVDAVSYTHLTLPTTPYV